jgi:CBS domain containing-hemolysin-like protein
MWSRMKGLVFGNGGETSLREQIEEFIDEAEDDPEIRDSANGSSDLSRVEREMLRNMLHFGEVTADDVAVPRADIVALDEKASFAEAVAIFADADHSRLPVYRDNLDNVIGMIHVKDLFRIMASNKRAPARVAKSLIRQPLYVPQAMLAVTLLAEMRAKRTHLAIVLDEYGGTEGLVTIEDLVEEIVGDIEDEHDDAPEELLIALPDGSWNADARAELEEIGDRIDQRLADIEEDVDTLGGLVVVLAGHVPQPGEEVEHPSGWHFVITEGDERRVARVAMHPPEASGEQHEDADA